MKIFLDDIRDPKECLGYMYRRIGSLNPIYSEGGWYIVRNYDEFIKAINSYYKDITHVSFDHDLADEHYTPEEYWNDFEKSKEYQESRNYVENTGYDCAEWLKKFYKDNNLELPIMFVHSMNPVGTQNIINVFK
jgi:hypothetical protein